MTDDIPTPRCDANEYRVILEEAGMDVGCPVKGACKIVDPKFARTLEREIHQLRATYCSDYFEKTIEKLAAENEKLRAALEFYAGNFPDDDLGNWQERVCEDEGDKARAALSAQEPQPQGEQR